MKSPKARVLAFYLPQYHPIPENDMWWGKGFTEWTNVGKAKSLFPGHYQPHVPADLGYYDLRVPETREAQARLAEDAGIEGFIYWHYWFGNGRQLLERPFSEVLSSGKPDFPFALAWANETWSGKFHGLLDGDTLIEQAYPGEQDDINHFYSLLPAFEDKRYIRCDNRPVFFIYRPFQFPDVSTFIKLWNQLALDSGLPGLFFVGIVCALYEPQRAKAVSQKIFEMGFDAVNVVNAFEEPQYSFGYRVIRKVFHKQLKIIPDIRPYDYSAFQCPIDGEEGVIPTITSNWDHTPRTGKRGIVLTGSSPEKFNSYLKRKLDLIKGIEYDKRFLVIKSWNEWAEGNYLEPDLKYGHQYLDAVRNALFDQ